MKKNLIIAIFLIITIVPFTFHTDTKHTLVYPAQKNNSIWNIWQYVENNPEFKFSHFAYPPLHFFLLKLFYSLMSPFVNNIEYNEWLASDAHQSLNHNNIYQFNLISKSPQVIFYLISGYLLYLISKKISPDNKKANLISLLWYINPIVIYSVLMMGQNDIFAILPFLVGWILLEKHSTSAIILMTLGAAIKNFPLIWIILLILAYKKFNIKNKIKHLLISLFTYIIPIIPFISTAAYQKIAFNDLTKRIFIAQLDLGFGDKIYIVPFLLAILCFIVLKKQTEKYNVIAQYLLTATLFFLGFSHFHVQWFVWTIPFWLIVLIHNIKKKNLLNYLFSSCIVFGAWFIILILFNDKYLQWGIIAPLKPSIINLLSIHDYLKFRNVDISRLNGLAHTAIAAFSIYNLYLISKKITQSKIEFKPKSINFNFFDKFPAQHQKFYKAFMILVFSITTVLFTSLLLNFLPGTKAEKKFDQYELISFNNLDNQTYSQQIIPQNANLTRLDILMNDSNLQNKDTITLEIYDQNNQTLYSHNINGLNVGHRSLVSFHIPENLLQKNKKYNFSIQSKPNTQLDNSNPIELGFKFDEKNQPISLAMINHYSQKALDMKYAIQESMFTIMNAIKQLLLFYVFAFAILLFLIKQNETN